MSSEYGVGGASSSRVAPNIDEELSSDDSGDVLPLMIEGGRGGRGKKSQSCIGRNKLLIASVLSALLSGIVCFALGAGPLGFARIKLGFRGIRWGSQYEEDRVLHEIFFAHMKAPGVFVEMGALDGSTMSNTIAYEEWYGWTGFLLEANPKSCAKLFAQERRSKSTRMCGAVCDDAKKRFLEFEFVDGLKDGALVGGAVEAISGMNDYWKNNWHGKGVVKTRTMVPCAPLSMMLRMQGIAAIDFFSLDVEGSEIHVLRTMDWTIPVHVWCIEVQEHDSAVIGELMKKHGYVRRQWPKEYDAKYTQNINQLWVDESYVADDKGNTAKWHQALP